MGQLVQFPGFCGGSSPVRSVNVNSERLINAYIETPPGNAKARPVILGTPGTSIYQVIGGGPGRGMFAQDGRLFAVSGSEVYELYANGTAQHRGLMTSTTEGVSWACNGAAGHQLLICSGGIVYLFDLITGLFFPAVQANLNGPIASVAFIGGYFTMLNTVVGAFYPSDPENGLIVDPGEAEQVSAASNALVTQLANRLDLWLFGNVTTTVWAISANADIPFAQIPGSLMDYGIVGPSACALIMNTVIWVARNQRGTGRVILANGYNPEPISNPAVEKWLQQAPRIAEAVVWTYQMESHSWAVISIPGEPTAWQVDLPAGVWTELGDWTGLGVDYTQPRAQYHAFAFDQHFVQDRLSGAVSVWSLDTTINTVVV